MANIKLSELSPTGSELFHDSESFINELSSEEIGDVLGGAVKTVITQGGGSYLSQVTVSAGHITKTSGYSFDSDLDIDDLPKIDNEFLRLLFIRFQGKK